MNNDDKANDRIASVTPTGRQMVNDLARHSGAALRRSEPTPGAMCLQGQDWSRGHSCIPQKFIRLVGYRDPDARPTTPIPYRPSTPLKTTEPSDTPIG